MIARTPGAYAVPYVDQLNPPKPAVTPVTPGVQNPHLAAALAAAREVVRQLEALQ